MSSVAFEQGRTLFPSTRKIPGFDGPPLKSGFNNVKIGGKVQVGRLKGAPIYTLTLEERATCPRECAAWKICYGNNMQMAHRQRHGAPLTKSLLRQMAQFQSRHPDGFLVRLHVLGDFYSKDYVAFWAQALFHLPALHVFGFTARRDEIWDCVKLVRDRFPDRFMIRRSGDAGEWGSRIFPGVTREKRHGEDVVCPEQIDALDGSPRGMHCGACAVCWQTTRGILFMEH